MSQPFEVQSVSLNDWNNSDSIFYVVPVTGGGICLEIGPDNVRWPTRGNLAKGRKSQLWQIVIRRTGVFTQAAFRNCGDGKWLRTDACDAYSKTETSEQQQWWTLEEGRAPSSFKLKCTDYDNPTFLCNDCGRWSTDNNIFVYPGFDDHAHEESWYFIPAKRLESREWLLTEGMVLESNV